MFAIFSVTSDRAPGNCRFTATNAVLDNILAEVKERQITATACNFQKRMTRFFKKSGVRTTMCDNVSSKCYQEFTKCEGTGSAKLMKHLFMPDRIRLPLACCYQLRWAITALSGEH